MNRERAETHLRLRAEAELRRAAVRPRRRAAEVEAGDRLARVARVLTAVRALDDQVVGQILADFFAALAIRQVGRARLHGAQRISRSARLRPGQPPAGPAWVIPLGQKVSFRAYSGDGELTVLSYARTASSAFLTIFSRARGIPPFLEFPVTDDRGTSYRLGTAGSHAGPHGLILRLHPEPPHDPRWLDLTAASGPPARLRLDPGAGAGEVAVTVTENADSPGEHLLNNLAMKLLSTAPRFHTDDRLPLPPLRATAPGHAAGALADVVEALQACGALSPLSPVPGQLAALYASFDGAGTGTDTGTPLPERWLSVLAYYQRRKHDADSGHDACAALAVALPELDGARLAVLGLHHDAGGTLLHIQATGLTWYSDRGPLELSFSPTLWIRDSGGRWHATSVHDWSEVDGEVTMRLRVVPPLSHAVTWIEVLAAAPSAQARAVLPVRWQ